MLHNQRLQVVYSSQYKCSAIVIPPEATREDAVKILEVADWEEAIYYSDEPYYVVQFPGRPIECYTENALRRSLPKVEEDQ